MSEPPAVNTLVAEAQALRHTVLKELPSVQTSSIGSVFGENSELFEELVLDEWRLNERFAELVDVLIYRAGLRDYWKQALIDLKLKGNEIEAMRLLDGLYDSRLKVFEGAAGAIARHPDNRFAAANFFRAKGEVMDVLYEQTFLAENKREEDKDQKVIAKVRAKFDRFLGASSL